jgi:hypothetical protein
LKRADRASLTYEYVKPVSAITLSQKAPGEWAHALLLGGPLQRHEIRQSDLVLNWIRRNSESLRRQISLLNNDDRDEECGLVLVLATFTSPRYADVRFLSHAEGVPPVIMGRISRGFNGGSKWIRGYPVDTIDDNFEGEFLMNEGEEVCCHVCFNCCNKC